MPNPYRLKGASLEEIRRKAELQHGPAARIVSAERITSPGIAGLFAGDRYEAIIEVPAGREVVTGEVIPEADTAAAPLAAAAPAHRLQGAAIAALLDEADADELKLHRPVSAGLSTESPDFAELLEQLGAGLRVPAAVVPDHAQYAVVPDRTRYDAAVAAAAPMTTAPAPRREMVPTVLSGVGDLVVLIGLGDDALDAALAMSTAAGGADVRTAGKLSAYGHLHVEGRQGATAARAHAVLTEQTVVVAFGLGKARDAIARLQSVAALSGDQLWVVVDAGRKAEDTARWVGVLAAQLTISAVAVIGTAETATPETVNKLGLPLGWIDSAPAHAVTI